MSHLDSLDQGAAGMSSACSGSRQEPARCSVGGGPRWPPSFSRDGHSHPHNRPSEATVTVFSFSRGGETKRGCQEREGPAQSHTAASAGAGLEPKSCDCQFVLLGVEAGEEQGCGCDRPALESQPCPLLQM